MKTRNAIAIATALIGTALITAPAQAQLDIEISRYVQINTGGPDMLQLTYNPAAGDDNLYVVSHGGSGGASIYRIDRSGPSPTVSTWLDVGATLGDLAGGGHGGVRSVAFHPDYASNGLFYTSAVQNRSGATAGSVYLGSSTSAGPDSVVTEWTANPGTGVVDTGSARELFRVQLPTFDHPVKRIGFNPYAQSGDDDYGMLYIAHGDAGTQSGGTGQVGSDALGKILLINPLDPDGAGAATYSVPGTNPFVGADGQAPDGGDIIDEVYALGFRNPHNFGWARDGSGGVHLILADIGQNAWEEVNIVNAGDNYGWRDREGDGINTGGGPTSPLVGLDSFTYPVAQFDHSAPGGNAIAGGFVGPAGSDLEGVYLFADFPQGDTPIYYTTLADMLAATTQMSTGPGDLSQAAVMTATTYFDDDDNPLTPSVAMTIEQILTAGPDHDGSPRSDLRFGQGPGGEIYILNKHNGWVYLVNSSVAVPTPGALTAGLMMMAAITTRRPRRR